MVGICLVFKRPDDQEVGENVGMKTVALDMSATPSLVPFGKRLKLGFTGKRAPEFATNRADRKTELTMGKQTIWAEVDQFQLPLTIISTIYATDAPFKAPGMIGKQKPEYLI
jgi:hypothetical protein